MGCDDFCFFQCREPPLNLKIFVSTNTFDNSTFFYEQLKFTWLVQFSNKQSARGTEQGDYKSCEKSKVRLIEPLVLSRHLSDPAPSRNLGK
jgi:hypothetical protein